MSKKEYLDTFTENMEFLAVRSRDEVHRLGLWHQTFHCWLLQQDENRNYILFQKRCARKKDYPGYLDITAAGHLEAGEDPLDGIREIREELGIDIEQKDLIPIGVVPCLLRAEHFIDNEFGHVYLVDYSGRNEPFILQKDEVESILRIEFDQFRSLLNGTCHHIIGYDFTDGVEKQEVSLTMTDFLPHTESYYASIEHHMDAFFKSHKS
ncbi:NUDIX hydrolase [Paenibacillus sp. KN14-4R]|uniref:NUDIX hydrolase n=1 Tax=Paenibacillus sp. KN14-4R TaxID=3445773 RepID=UPI003FA01180